MINFSNACTIYESDEIFVIPSMGWVLKNVKLDSTLSIESGFVVNGGWYLHQSQDGLKWLGSKDTEKSDLWEIGVRNLNNTQYAKIPMEILRHSKISIFEWAKKVVYKF